MRLTKIPWFVSGEQIQPLVWANNWSARDWLMTELSIVLSSNYQVEVCFHILITLTQPREWYTIFSLKSMVTTLLHMSTTLIFAAKHIMVLHMSRPVDSYLQPHSGLLANEKEGKNAYLNDIKCFFSWSTHTCKHLMADEMSLFFKAIINVCDNRWSREVLLSGPAWDLQVEFNQVSWSNQRCASFGKIKNCCWRNVSVQQFRMKGLSIVFNLETIRGCKILSKYRERSKSYNCIYYA